MAEIAYSRRVGSKRIGTGGVRRVGPYTVDVAPDLVFPQWFEVSGLHLEAYPGLTFGVRATWNAEKLAFDLRQLSLESDSGIEGEQLRELSRNEILRGTQVLLAHVHVDDGSTAPLVWEAEGIARAVEAGPVPPERGAHPGQAGPGLKQRSGSSQHHLAVFPLEAGRQAESLQRFAAGFIQ